MTSGFEQQIRQDPMSWLHTVGEEFSAEIFRNCSEFSLKQGQTIYRADDPPSGIFTVLDGRIDLHWAHLASETSLFYATGPGWWVGDLAALSGTPRRFDLVAGRDSSILRLNRAVLMELFERSPNVLQGMIKMLTATLSGAVDIMQFLSTENPTLRTAACLFALNVTGRGWNGAVPLSQSELASITRISRRRTNSALAELEAAGTIERGYGVIWIRDEDKLRSASFNLPSTH